MTDTLLAAYQAERYGLSRFFWGHSALLWVEVSSTAVEEDRFLEVLAVTIAS
jgi:hypothetical protein